MAARISESFEIEPLLIDRGNSIFDVRLDDALIYSKGETGEYPTDDQVIQRLHAALN